MFLINLDLLKSVDDWDNETGAKGNHSNMDHWKGAIPTHSLDDVKRAISRWIEGYGLDLDKFECVEYNPKEDLERRFSFCQVENGDSLPDNDGKYLADYELFVTLQITKDIECPDLGLKY